MNTGRGNEDNLVDAEGSCGLEDLEGAAHIEVKEIVRIFLAAVFVDPVPRGDVDDAIAPAKCLGQFRALQNGPVDKGRSLFEMTRCANIENDRRVASVEQPGHESLAEISRSSGQKHFHDLIPDLCALPGHTQAGRNVCRHRIDDLTHPTLTARGGPE